MRCRRGAGYQTAFISESNESHHCFLPLPYYKACKSQIKKTKEAEMADKIANGDIKILSWIAEYKFLTAKQLAAISLRSMQVIRRRLRSLRDDCLISLKERDFGGVSGRLEYISFLTEKGLELIRDKEILSAHAKYITDKTAESIFIDHDLLVNWFFIHLIQVGRENSCLSTQHLTISSHNLNKGNADKPLLMERFSNNKSSENHSMIPDGVFIITDKESEKALLFFLEVDMGTEKLFNSKGKPNNVRQKIINYQALFRTGQYKRYEKIFNVSLNGFRLLFLSKTHAKLKSLCKLVREMQPTDFVWLAAEDQMFSNGLSAEIWVRGGKDNEQLQSILGHRRVSKITVTDKIR
jgi:hypothetical protein